MHESPGSLGEWKCCILIMLSMSTPFHFIYVAISPYLHTIYRKLQIHNFTARSTNNQEGPKMSIHTLILFPDRFSHSSWFNSLNPSMLCILLFGKLRTCSVSSLATPFIRTRRLPAMDNYENSWEEEKYCIHILEYLRNTLHRGIYLCVIVVLYLGECNV